MLTAFLHITGVKDRILAAETDDDDDFFFVMPEAQTRAQNSVHTDDDVMIAPAVMTRPAKPVFGRRGL